MINIWYRLADLILPYSTLWVLCWLFVPSAYALEIYHWVGLAASIALLVTTQVLGGYDSFSQRTIARKLEVVFKGWFAIVLLLILVTYLLNVLDLIGRLVFVLWVLLVPLLIIVSKVLLNRVCLSRNQDERLWVLLGSDYAFTELEQARLAHQKIKIVNLCHSDLAETKAFFSAESVDGIILNVKDVVPNELVQFLTRLELSGTKLYSINHFFERFLRKLYIAYDVVGIDYLDNVHKLSRSNYVLKRLIDIVFAGTLLLITLPVMIFTAFKIKKESPGRVFFKQSRVGVNATCFEAIKFRSMHENSHFNPYTQERDERIFPYGEFMRKSRIDELPQLWNVLKGDMHVCGPRTEWDILVENYEKEIPFYHERHLVKPGITGWAQVMYPYGANTEDARQKLMYDLYYIKNWSVWLELEVLIRTVLVVLGKKGL